MSLHYVCCLLFTSHDKTYHRLVGKQCPDVSAGGYYSRSSYSPPPPFLFYSPFYCRIPIYTCRKYRNRAFYGSHAIKPCFLRGNDTLHA